MTQEPYEQDPLSPEIIEAFIDDVSGYLDDLNRQDEIEDEQELIDNQLYDDLVRGFDERLAQYSEEVSHRLFFDPEATAHENISQLAREKRQLGAFYMDHVISYIVGDEDVDRQRIASVTMAANRLETSLNRKAMIYALSDDLVTAVADADLDLCALTIARVGRGHVMPNREISAITQAFYAYLKQFDISLTFEQIQAARERVKSKDAYNQYAQPTLYELSFTVTQLVAEIGDMRWFEDWPDFVSDVASFDKVAPPFDATAELQEETPDLVKMRRTADYYANRIRQHTYRMGMDVVECERLMHSLFRGAWK